MPELTGTQVMLMWFAAAAGVVLMLAVLRRFKTKAQREAALEVERVQKDNLRKAVAAGTHNERAQPLCRVCGDKNDPETVATEYGYRVERDTGLQQWGREQLGAPGRWRVGRTYDDELRYCREHGALARAEAEVYLLAFEQQRRETVRDAETELAHFEKAGLDARLKARVQNHEKAIKRDGADRPPASTAKVVAIR